MKISLAQLEAHLTKTLTSSYLICSDQDFLAQEAADLIQKTAKTAGFHECIRITAEAPEWEKLFYNTIQDLSLFSQKRLLIVQGITKFNQAIGKILQASIHHAHPDLVLVIQLPKLDKKTEQTDWFKLLEKNSVVIPIWPITTEQFPAWILQRGQKAGLTFTKSAVNLLTERLEGNLLAAAQAIEKLCLWQPNQSIDETVIEQVIADHALFDVFDLVESALSGQTKRALHIVESLRTESTEPTLMLWALTRELRLLIQVMQQSQQGTTLSAIFHQLHIWEKRQPSIRAFLKNHTLEHCWKMLSQAAEIDRIIKGAESGAIWDELERFVLRFTNCSQQISSW